MSNTEKPPAPFTPATLLLLTQQLAAQARTLELMNQRICALEEALLKAAEPSKSGPTLAEVVEMLDALDKRMDRAIDSAEFAAGDAKAAAAAAAESSSKADSAAWDCKRATEKAVEQTAFLERHEPGAFGGWKVKKDE